jgi:hypothetical protein
MATPTGETVSFSSAGPRRQRHSNLEDGVPGSVLDVRETRHGVFHTVPDGSQAEIHTCPRVVRLCDATRHERLEFQGILGTADCRGDICDGLQHDSEINHSGARTSRSAMT